MQLSHQLAEFVRACFAGVWLESHEHEDAILEIAQLCITKAGSSRSGMSNKA